MAVKRGLVFARFSLDYADHPKIAILSDAAFRAHVEMILYARKYLTDGRIPNRFANRFGFDVLQELASNDPERPSITNDVDGDYWIHDFTDMQETRDEVEAKRLVNTQNGRRGGRPAKRTGNRNETQSVSGSLTESPSEMKAETETETETKPLRGLGGAGGGLSSQPPASLDTHSAATAAPKQKRGTRLPAGWQPSRTPANEAAEQALSRDQLRGELAKFVDYWAAKAGAQATKLDWDATWRNWIRNAAERAPRRNGRQTAAAMTTSDWDNLMQAAIAQDIAEGNLP